MNNKIICKSKYLFSHLLTGTPYLGPTIHVKVFRGNSILRVVLFFVAMLTALSAQAQFRFAQQQVHTKGYLLDADSVWLGTGNGVVKMLRDGSLLQRWTREAFPSLQGSPSVIIKDNNGRLLTYSDFWGIRRFNGTDWETITDPFTPVIGPLSFFDMVVDDQNRIVLGGGGMFIYRQNGTAWEQIPLPFVANRLKRGPDGDLWINGGGLVARYNGVNWTTSEASLPNKRFCFDFTWDTNGDLFAIFYQQNFNIPEIWKFPQGDLDQPELVVAIPEYAQSGNPPVFYAESIAIDAQGRIWLGIAGFDFNFIRRDGDTWTELGGHTNSPFPLFAYSESRMTPDPDGSMWIASRINADPLYRYADDTGWQAYENSFSEMGYAGAVGMDGKIYFGGPRFIGSYDPATDQYRHQALGANGTVHDMTVSPYDSTVYAATETGLWAFDGQDWDVALPINYPASAVVNVEVAPDNSVWAVVITSNGQTLEGSLAVRASGGNWQHIPLPTTTSGLAITPDTAVWLPAFDRIYRYKNGAITVFDSITTGYPFTEISSPIFHLETDGKGQVWTFIQNLGLLRYDGVQWTVFSKENSGLYSNYGLHRMKIDAGGDLWLSFADNGTSQRALQVFNGSNWRSFFHYNSNISSYAITAIAAGPDGQMWFHSTYDFFSFKWSPSWLRGQLRRDTNGDCLPTAPEPPLPRWIARAISASGEKSYSITKPDGQYELNLDSGAYTVQLFPPASVWGDCDGIETVNLGQASADTIDFAGESLSDCPLMNIELDVPFLRRCFSARYQLRYCNFGTAAASQAIVDLDIPPELEVQALSLPYDVLSPGKIRVALGDVAEGICGSFTLDVLPACDAQLSASVCVQAHISPDTLCQGSPGWSGADLHASAECTSDTVYFLLQNKGFGDMIQALDYVIIEDEVIMRIAPVQIPAGDSVTIAFPVSSSYQRIQLPQEPGHPYPGLVSAAVEACNGQPFSSFVAQYPFDNPSPFYTQTCAVIKGSFDPNDKSATPEGVKAEHYIWPRTELDYKIRFQNTGNDTAFTVVIRDTLPDWLDVATFRSGASSHAYEWDISGPGILTFVFDNIMLPDSNVNEVASHGFVAFKITPADSTPLGTLLENRAGIYFDFNDPIITNTVFHTVDTGFLAYNMVDAVLETSASSLLSVFPNPAVDWIRVSMPGHFFKSGAVRVSDVYGRMLMQQKFQGESVTTATQRAACRRVYIGSF